MPVTNPQLFSGARWQATHKATVVSILGSDAPDVLSYGSKFFNQDRWTVRFFVQQMCDWAKSHPKSVPDTKTIDEWVRTANGVVVKQRRIVIAATPARISMRVALALVGGGYHEAFHTKYSCRRTLTTAEMQDIILPRWGKTADWSVLYTLLQEWNNIVEDIRIERRGNDEYPGCLAKLHALQDFILRQEMPKWDVAKPLSTATALFRDLGLGYNTSLQEQALRTYRSNHPNVCVLVELGPIKQHLDAAIALSDIDDLGCLRVAMDILLELTHLRDPTPEHKTIDEGLEVAGVLTDWAEPAQAVLVPGQVVDILDLCDALRDEFSQATANEDRDCEAHERPWRPWTTSFDVVEKVKPSRRGQATDEEAARKLSNEVRSESAFLRSRLRAIVRAVEQRSVTHGVRRGIELSDRMIVDTVASIRSNAAPDRAYYRVGERIDTSVAAAIFLDESSSMASNRTGAAQCILALADAIDSIGGATIVFGIRSSFLPTPLTQSDHNDIKQLGCHRVAPVHYDIFKTFDERFSTVRWRFANTMAIGDTPMADGIQFGLDALMARQERHRILFAITDGDPNPKHEPVIVRQIRLARRAGFHIIGVGIGPGASRVIRLFPAHVWSNTIQEMPAILIRELNQTLDFRKPR